MASKKWNVENLQSESSYWHSCILITAAHLDLFGWMGKQEKNSRSAAAHFGGHAVGWEIFLNALCGMGLMRKRGAKFSNSAFASRHLSGTGATLLLPNYDAWNSWGGLASSLITGNRPRTQKPFISDRAQAKRLLCALDLHAQQIAPYMIAKLPLSGCRTLLDVGGGLGSFAAAFCHRYPRLRATVVEHPKILPLARQAIRDSGMAKRVRLIGVDFSRDALPRGFDCVFVSNVLHAHGVAENRSLLTQLHRCLNARGHLILRDVFMSRDRTAPEWGALFSVSLLLHTPQGRCYGLDEILRWLREAGFSRIRGPLHSSPLPFDPDSILIAKKS
jgi:ubiquinone/menaquinone biosynthesis C-methylase UbiE